MKKYPCDNIKVISGWEAVLHRPGMYLGKRSIYGLECFICGLRCANCDMFFNDHQFDHGFEFENWVHDQIGIKKKNKRSFELALEQAENDDEKAFDIWA